MNLLRNLFILAVMLFPAIANATGYRPREYAMERRWVCEQVVYYETVPVRYERDYYYRDNRGGNAVAGAVVGGLIGHAVDRHHGGSSDRGAVVGAIAGGVIGHNSGRGYSGRESYVQYERRAFTREHCGWQRVYHDYRPRYDHPRYDHPRRREYRRYHR